MKRDVIYTNGLVIAADNSGSIGEKPGDRVKADYETVGYFSARVALMECLAAGGEPFAIVLQNFADESAWKGLSAGAERAACQAECIIELTGSTEKNFVMNESAVSITVIGRHIRNVDKLDEKAICYGVIGKPLVGLEVLAESESVASLSLFRQVCEVEGVYSVLPVGSKGIIHEMRKWTSNEELQAENIHCSLDVKKSAGPATCFLVAVDVSSMPKLQEISKGLYTPLEIKF
ncbi:MAG TPA: ATP-binding protein [Pseudobacillus sp.]